MPVYVYKNLQTGETFELQQSIKDPALTVHPETGAPVKRVIQPVGIAFKGSGFYVTDSRQQISAKTKAEPKTDKADKVEGKTAPEGGKPPAKADGKDAKKDGKVESKPPKTASSSA